jgi:photosystem II stability/assembly factor-like uncharacterized protein
MRTVLYTLALAAILVAAYATYQYYYPIGKFVPIGRILEKEGEEEGKEAEMDKPDEGAKYYERLKTDLKLGRVPYERMFKVYEYMQNYLNTKQKGNTLPPPSITDARFRERGPYNVGGRTRAILVDKNDPTGETVYVGSVGGGLWRSTQVHSGNPNWRPVNDYFQNLAVCTIVQDPSNPQYMYFGTGEGYPNLDAIRGLAIWRSTDGGQNWAPLPSTQDGSFYYTRRLAITQTGVLFAATNSGVWRSTDKGVQWTKVAGGGVSGVASNYIHDIEIGSDGSVYAAYNFGVSSSPTGDEGTWTNINGTGFPTSGDRIELSVSPANVNRIYAITTEGAYASGVFRSDNKGANWSKIYNPQPSFDNGQGWYDLDIKADPSNADRVIIAGIDHFMSVNGGTSWTQLTTGYVGTAQGIHPDQHVVEFDPAKPQNLYLGHDGGLSYSTNANNSSVAGIIVRSMNSNYNVTQYYACAISNDTFSNNFLAGAQDNGTQRYDGEGIEVTEDVFGGDGFYCFIDQDEPNIQIASTYGGIFGLSTDGGISFSGGIQTGAQAFISPAEYDSKENTLYAYRGSNRFFRWKVGTPEGDAVTVSPSIGGIDHFAVSPNVPNRIYVGGSTVLRIDNAHQGTSVTGVNLGANGLPGGNVTSIVPEIGNENHLIVTYGNFGSNSVWETTDGGQSWHSIEGNLPDMPVYWSVINPHNPAQLLLATEAGVWATQQVAGDNTQWEPCINGMPFVQTVMLRYRTSDHFVLAGTHGRGLFTTDVFAEPKARLTFENVTYTNANTQFQDASVNARTFLWQFGDGTTSTLPNPTHNYATPGVYTVTLSINEGASTATRTMHVLPDKQSPYDKATTQYAGGAEANTNDFGITAVPKGSAFAVGASLIPGKEGTHDGGKCFVIDPNDGYYKDNTLTQLYTPNFDLSQAGIYQFSFWGRFKIENGRDGFIVEYSTDKGKNWSVFANTQQTNWYNFLSQDNTVAFPIGSYFFTGTNNAWTKYYHDLSFLSGQPNVAFRFTFRTNANTRYAGVAIDDIEVRKYNGELATNVFDYKAEFTDLQQITVQWHTLPEYQCTSFEPQITKNGRDFEPMATQKAAGYSIDDIAYSVSDESYKLDLYYCRIKTTSYDSSVTYTPTFIVRRNRSEEGINLVYPNPFTDQLVVTFNGIYTQPITVTVYNAIGQQVIQSQLPTGSAILSLQTTNLAQGTYVVHATIGNNTYTQKIIKTNR